MELFSPSLLGEYLRMCDPTLKDIFLGQNFATWRGKYKKALETCTKACFGGRGNDPLLPHYEEKKTLKSPGLDNRL
jgi:hypothetical protein